MGSAAASGQHPAMALVRQRRAHARPQRSPARARPRRPRRRVAAKPLPRQHSQRGARGPGERGGAGARSHLGGGGRRGARLERHAAERRAERGHGCSRGGVPRARFGYPYPAPPPRARAAGRHAAFFFFARPRADRAPRTCECILMICDAFFFFFFGPRPGASQPALTPGPPSCPRLPSRRAHVTQTSAVGESY